MEDTLGEVGHLVTLSKLQGLNPCSNGRYSRRLQEEYDKMWEEVLILVLMEDTLGV